MSMNERGNDFESRYAHDEERRFRIVARRNKLLGLWAAEKLGKSGEDAEEYAKAVVNADFAEPGGEEVFKKIRADFDAAGIDQSDHQVRRQMSELLTEAESQVANA